MYIIGVYVLCVQCVYIHAVLEICVYTIIRDMYAHVCNVGRLANGRHDFVRDRNTQKSSSYLFLFNRALSVSRSLTSKSWYICTRYTQYHLNIICIYMYVCVYLLQKKKKLVLQQPHQFTIRPHTHCGPKLRRYSYGIFLTAGDCYSTKTHT